MPCQRPDFGTRDVLLLICITNGPAQKTTRRGGLYSLKGADIQSTPADPRAGAVKQRAWQCSRFRRRGSGKRSGRWKGGQRNRVGHRKTYGKTAPSSVRPRVFSSPINASSFRVPPPAAGRFSVGARSPVPGSPVLVFRRAPNAIQRKHLRMNELTRPGGRRTRRCDQNHHSPAL